MILRKGPPVAPLPATRPGDDIFRISVTLGLDPRVHPASQNATSMDCRVTPGNDNGCPYSKSRSSGISGISAGGMG